MDIFAEDLEREDRVLVLGPAMFSVQPKVSDGDGFSNPKCSRYPKPCLTISMRCPTNGIACRMMGGMCEVSRGRRRSLEAKPTKAITHRVADMSASDR